MCNQRDRLIGFIYGEGAANELDEVQKHLDTCADCRAEVAGLRSVREDLLAWNVPDHESVWRPFAPAPVLPWWRQVPAWAMAAAASVLVVSGAAGGAIAYAFLPESSPVVTARVDGAQTPVTVGITDAQLAASEARVMAQMVTQIRALDARIQLASGGVSNEPRSASASLRTPAIGERVSGPNTDVTHDSLVAELVDLRDQLKQQLNIMATMNANFDQTIGKRYDYKIGAVENRLKNLEAIAQLQLGKPGGDR